MPYMIINRLPTEQDLEECFSLELHSFSEAFNRCSVAPFVAKVEFNNEVDDDGEQWERYELEGWTMSKGTEADWFTFVDENN
ncbi:hypothetical protein [Photobacterium sanguinicancri]|uniref:hypothetical protein n=1 Tax=Photobacterium sanguinicancri TaxID=875932 RepID=UPI0024816DEC|nr:hypothetical protein [Photobacterium sanguinicancri]